MLGKQSVQSFRQTFVFIYEFNSICSLMQSFLQSINLTISVSTESSYPFCFFLAKPPNFKDV